MIGVNTNGLGCRGPASIKETDVTIELGQWLLPRITRDIETEISKALSDLSIGDKINLLAGEGVWSTSGNETIGLTPMSFSHGEFGLDSRDGELAPVFPAPSALAATWDDDAMRTVGTMLAAEARRLGINVILAPTVNLQRSPSGDRHVECFSEDPVLTGRLASGLIRSVQDQGVGVCMKFYVANEPETDASNVLALLDDRTLRELYLAPLEHAVTSASPWSIMAAHKGIDDRSGTGRSTEKLCLVVEELKEQWDYDGAVISDWLATKSVENVSPGGLDLLLPAPRGPWRDHFLAAAASGELPIQALDDKVARILRLAGRAGTWSGGPTPSVPPDHAKSQPDTATSGTPCEIAGLDVTRELTRIAAHATVLLSNSMPDGAPLLPLNPLALRKVALIGPNAVEPFVHRARAPRERSPAAVCPEAGLRAALPDGVELTVCRGGSRQPTDDDAVEREIAEAVRAASQADVAVVIVGTDDNCEWDASNPGDLAMPGRQDELVRRVAAANPATVVLVNAGAPRILPWLDEAIRPAATAWWWLPGQAAGHALAAVLFGEIEPSGRLPWTLPARRIDAPPSFGDAQGMDEFAERRRIGYRSWDGRGRIPARAFGFGMGYGRWAYRQMEIEDSGGAWSDDGREGAVRVRVHVTNVGRRAAREVVQFYLEPCGARGESIGAQGDAPLWALAGHVLEEVGPGETVIAEAVLPRRVFETWDSTSSSWVWASDAFRLWAARDSRDFRDSAVWVRGR